MAIATGLLVPLDERREFLEFYSKVFEPILYERMDNPTKKTWLKYLQNLKPHVTPQRMQKLREVVEYVKANPGSTADKIRSMVDQIKSMPRTAEKQKSSAETNTRHPASRQATNPWARARAPAQHSITAPRTRAQVLDSRSKQPPRAAAQSPPVKAPAEAPVKTRVEAPVAKTGAQEVMGSSNHQSPRSVVQPPVEAPDEAPEAPAEAPEAPAEAPEAPSEAPEAPAEAPVETAKETPEVSPSAETTEDAEETSILLQEGERAVEVADAVETPKENPLEVESQSREIYTGCELEQPQNSLRCLPAYNVQAHPQLLHQVSRPNQFEGNWLLRILDEAQYMAHRETDYRFLPYVDAERNHMEHVQVDSYFAIVRMAAMAHSAHCPCPNFLGVGGCPWWASQQR